MTTPSPKKFAPATLGGKLPRIDGALKVSGRAVYTSDVNLPGMLYAVPVCATIAAGKVAGIDDGAARKLPGVKGIFTGKNIGPFYRSAPPTGFSGRIDEKRPPFEDDVVRYYGQYVALAVAQTFEQATAAAAAVSVRYEKAPHDLGALALDDAQLKIDSHRGDADAAFAAAPVKLDQTYRTPTETHNPIELHATVAAWDGDSVTLYETSQAIVNHRDVLYQMLGVPRENVRVVSHFLGSGFGGKLWPWTHSLLAAGASRALGRPVKLVVSRQSMFETVGHRPETRQRFRLGALPNGKLVSMRHDYVSAGSIDGEYKENCGESTPFLYSVPNLLVKSTLAKRNVGSPTSMRGPGAVPGLYALESAMDELAIQLKMDPLELRLVNDTPIDEEKQLPFSSRYLRECLETGAKKFGWSGRDPRPGSMTRDGLVVGWGMSACSWGAQRFEAEAMVELRDDGTARVATATQDIGTGTYTVLAIVVSELTGIPIERIEVALGDTILPPGPISGGSRATASVIPAVAEASRKAMVSALAAASTGPRAPFTGLKPIDLTFANGQVSKKADPKSSMDFATALKKANVRAVTGMGKSASTAAGREIATYSLHSFGAHFCEVTWQPEIARLRVKRFVSVFDAGRIINLKTGRNQIEGAIVMGVGMALLEETSYDKKVGAPLNSNLADYMVTTNADSPEIDVTFLDHPDLVLNELGARGVGEIGLAGTAAAITSAVHHATGVRVRDLPVRIEDLIASQA